MKSIFSILLLLVCWTSIVQAQSGLLKKANRKFRELSYKDAQKLYARVLDKNTVPQALFNIATCYRKIGNTKKAEEAYARAVLHPEATAEHYFYLGMAQLSNGKPSLAKANFEKYRELEPKSRRGLHLMKACSDSLIKELQNAGSVYTVKKEQGLSTKFDDYGVTSYGEGILYASDRDTTKSFKKRSSWMGKSSIRLYYAAMRLIDEDLKIFKHTSPKPYTSDLKNRYNDGPVAFNKSQNKIFITRHQSTSSGLNTQILSSEKLKGEWAKLEGTSLNDRSYSVAYPTINADGDKMFFASDMPGGNGGFDLYVSYYEGSEWGEPINLGPEVNTEGDELSPFLANNGTLYFSSDGHAGLGGFDVYFSRVNEGIWDPVVNIGAPINSEKDEISFYIEDKGKYGYFASSRDGGKGGLDIYSFTKLTVDVEILAFDKSSGLGIEEVEIKSACFPRAIYTTNADGKVYLQMPKDRNCKLFASSKEYGEVEIDFSTQGYAIGAELIAQIPFDAKPLTFSVQGVVMNQSTQQPIAGASIVLMSSCNQATISATSDENGNYQFDLQSNCSYVVKAAKRGYFTSTNNFFTKGLSESSVLNFNIKMPKAPMAGVEIGAPGVEYDTSSVFIVDNLYYSANSARINVNTGLQDLLTLLQQNENMGVEIHSFCDSNGPFDYNMDLSKKRSYNVAAYLIENGINEGRINHEGMGETQLMNACMDGVECTDEQHAVNRRTEFRVFKMN